MALTPRSRNRKRPRVLIVTPEITYLPKNMGNMANRTVAKAGGLADVSASLVSALFELHADVHVALPHYRRMFNVDAGRLVNRELRVYKSKLPNAQIHLAEDRCFYYRGSVYETEKEDVKVALAFQREVINNIIPLVDPDLIHCNDWMTGLIPAASRRLDIPCLFTVHNIHTNHLSLERVEDSGIDAAEFWKSLFFAWPPTSYEESRVHNRIDLLASGIFAAHFINTVSPTFLSEIVDGQHDFIPPNIRAEIIGKAESDCARGILNAPDATFDPETDIELDFRFTAENAEEGKRENKLLFQEHTGLTKNPDAPIFFWPSRLDPVQKGCQLLADILHDVVTKYEDEHLQIAIVANGPYQNVFHEIVRAHDLYGRVAVCDFGETLSHQGYAASDFMLIPSLFEPCGLPQMVSPLYGSLPIARNTGGLHDTVDHLNVANDSGNGFLFDSYDGNGLNWAIDEAMRFYALPQATKTRQISRIMTESAARFTHHVTAQNYFAIYERMLERPLVKVY